MSMQSVQTSNAPAAIGPYSQAVKTGTLIFISGQLPLHPATGEIVAGGIEAQARQTLHNVKAMAEAAGADLSRVVKTTVFLADLNDFAAMNRIYGEFFKAPCPARACVQVARLPKDARIEIEAIAVSLSG